MPIRNLNKIFEPQRVAVIGASRKKISLGYKVLENLRDARFPGAVYPSIRSMKRSAALVAMRKSLTCQIPSTWPLSALLHGRCPNWFASVDKQASQDW